MASKYGTIPITDEELSFLLSTLTSRRHALGVEIHKIMDKGLREGDRAYDEVISALSKAKSLTTKLLTLRKNAKLN